MSTLPPALRGRPAARARRHLLARLAAAAATAVAVATRRGAGPRPESLVHGHTTRAAGSEPVPLRLEKGSADRGPDDHLHRPHRAAIPRRGLRPEPATRCHRQDHQPTLLVPVRAHQPVHHRRRRGHLDDRDVEPPVREPRGTNGDDPGGPAPALREAPHPAGRPADPDVQRHPVHAPRAAATDATGQRQPGDRRPARLPVDADRRPTRPRPDLPRPDRGGRSPADACDRHPGRHPGLRPGRRDRAAPSLSAERARPPDGQGLRLAGHRARRPVLSIANHGGRSQDVDLHARRARHRGGHRARRLPGHADLGAGRRATVGAERCHDHPDALRLPLDGSATLHILAPSPTTVPVQLTDLAVDQRSLSPATFTGGTLFGREAPELASLIPGGGSMVKYTTIAYTPTQGLTLTAQLALPGITPLPFTGSAQLTAGAVGMLTITRRPAATSRPWVRTRSPSRCRARR